MFGWRNILPTLTAFVLSWATTSSILAGVAGKISGAVMDSEKSTPVVGATVKVLGTRFVTMTDEDGEYFIISIPIGKYSVAVTNVGFESITQENVRVLVDLTTPVDFQINPTTVQLGEEVIVTAQKPTIQRDLTASRVIFTADQLKQLPNIITVQSVLTNYPGVVVDRENDIHVRGGRAGQVSYYFDGFSVQDPFISQSGIKIMPSALEELSLTSGGYTAEYGEALSGVVSAVTREGSPIYRGGFRVYEGATHPYNVTAGKWSGLERVGNRAFSFDLSGPIPALNSPRYTFFVAGEYLHDPSFLPHNGSVSYTGTAKLSFQPERRLRLKANVTYYNASGEEFEHRDVNNRSYDLNLDGLPSFEKHSYLVGVSGQYSFSEKVIASASVNRFSTNSKSAPGTLFDLYWKQWPGYSEDSAGNYNGTIHEDNYLGNIDFSDVRQLTGFTVGDDFDPSYRWREAVYDALKFSVLGQLNKSNQLKTGIEYRKYSLDWDFKQFFNLNPFGEKYSSKPAYFSSYVQDKLEYSDFIINVGLRFDFRNADISYNVNPGGLAPVYKEADSKSRLAPRLGISFPISEKSKMHFNYGIYYQDPRFTYLYTNLDGDVSTGLPLLGNPDLDPEQTTSYELGLDHLIKDNLRLNITAYYKDIDDLVTTRSSFQVGGFPVTHFDNDDYGSVKGVDITMERLPLNGTLSGSISYTYMIATGNGSTALEPYYTYITSTSDTLAPVTEYPLDFDQRHTITALVSFRATENWDARMFGAKIPGAWGVNFVAHYGSGLPYTATDNKGVRLGERNEARLPANFTVDMKFIKDFGFGKQYANAFSFFVEVDNLFNRRNVLGVYTNTGRPDNDGNRIGAGFALDADEINLYDFLFDHDPQNFSPPRTIRVGMEFSF